MNALITQIAGGDRAARNTFIEKIQPWLDYTQARLAEEVFAADGADKEQLHDICVDAALKGIELVESGRIKDWQKLNPHMQQLIKQKMESIARREEKDADIEGRRVPLSGKTWRKLPDGAPDIAEQAELEEAIEQTLSRLPEREKDALLRHHDGNETLEEISKKHGVGIERIRQIILLSQNTFMFPENHAPAVKEWVRDWEASKGARHNAANAKQRGVNAEILSEIGEDFLKPKREISKVLKGRTAFASASNRKLHSWTRGHLTDENETSISDLQIILDAGEVKYLEELGAAFKTKDVAIFRNAIADLRNAFARFEELGGKAVGEDIAPAEPIAGLEIARTRAMMEQQRKAEAANVREEVIRTISSQQYKLEHLLRQALKPDSEKQLFRRAESWGGANNLRELLSRESPSRESFETKFNRCLNPEFVELLLQHIPGEAHKKAVLEKIDQLKSAAARYPREEIYRGR